MNELEGGLSCGCGEILNLLLASAACGLSLFPDANFEVSLCMNIMIILFQAMMPSTIFNQRAGRRGTGAYPSLASSHRIRCVREGLERYARDFNGVATAFVLV